MLFELYNGFRRLSIPLLLGLERSSSSSAFAISGKPALFRVQQQRLCLSVAHGGGGPALPDDDGLPLDFPRRTEVLIALNAVRQACRVTQSLQPLGTNKSGNQSGATTSNNIATVEKADLSPVTVADYAVQALILHLLHSQFPQDGFIAEEDSAALLQDDSLLQQVLSATGLSDKEKMLHGLDLGKSYTKWSDTPPKKIWTLDPIDGTKGFLRGKFSGGQYAIALALLEDGKPVIGVLGCPNLPTDVNDEQYAWRDDEGETTNADNRGCIFVASKGGGCYQLALDPANNKPSIQKLKVTPNDASTRQIQDGRFCIGVEKFSDALGQTPVMAKILHGEDVALDENGEIIRARRIDSQAKHGVIARGGAEWYVRLPKPGYVEWIWDHAAGNVVIEEAGGEMTDTLGQPLDFSLGAKLSPDVRGILMSNGGVFHKALVNSFAKEESLRNQ